MSRTDENGKTIYTLQEKIDRYKGRAYHDEDQFHIATAVILDHLMEMDELGWFHANQNLYRRGLTALRKYIPAKFKARLTTLAANLGAKGKRMGIKPGVSDCIVYSHLLAIELKVPGKHQSKDQKAWAKLVTRWGWHYEVCKTPESVLGVLEGVGLLSDEIIERGESS